MERGKILESSINLKMDKSVRFASQDNFKSLNLFQRSAKTLRSLIIGINEREREIFHREKRLLRIRRLSREILWDAIENRY